MPKKGGKDTNMAEKEYLEALVAELEAADELAKLMEEAHTEKDMKVVETAINILSLKHKIITDIYKLGCKNE